MIIVAGHLTVDPDRRKSILHSKRDLAIAARSAAGCHDFHMSADPVEIDRINIYERWASVDDVEAFRGAGPGDEEQHGILGADVAQLQSGATRSCTSAPVPPARLRRRAVKDPGVRRKPVLADRVSVLIQACDTSLIERA